MKITVDFQKACCEPTPSAQDFEAWIQSTKFLVQHSTRQVEVNIRAIDEQEMSLLNFNFRDKAGATNVLSFPAELSDEIDLNLLGDIAICAPIVKREATILGRSENSHWAHLTVHGMLHLIGYDHINASKSSEMESLEIRILEELGISNPYVIETALENPLE